MLTYKVIELLINEKNPLVIQYLIKLVEVLTKFGVPEEGNEGFGIENEFLKEIINIVWIFWSHQSPEIKDNIFGFVKEVQRKKNSQINLFI